MSISSSFNVEYARPTFKYPKGALAFPSGTKPVTALALGSPGEVQKGTNFWYNFSIQSAGGGLLANNLNFQVQSTTGAIVPPTGWTMNVLGLTGSSIATYSMTAGSWTTGGTTALTSTQQIALDATSSLSGDTLIVSGAGSFAGSITVAIP